MKDITVAFTVMCESVVWKPGFTQWFKLKLKNQAYFMCFKIRRNNVLFTTDRPCAGHTKLVTPYLKKKKKVTLAVFIEFSISSVRTLIPQIRKHWHYGICFKKLKCGSYKGHIISGDETNLSCHKISR